MDCYSSSPLGAVEAHSDNEDVNAPIASMDGDRSSRVLLASFEGSKATHEDLGGVFATALVRTLTEADRPTYTSIIESLPVKKLCVPFELILALWCDCPMIAEAVFVEGTTKTAYYSANRAEIPTAGLSECG
jgi:hypothetical protein